MFAANDQIEGCKITAIAPEWAEPAALESLRRWCHDDRIRCPWCEAPVVIKAGEIKTRHFAHKCLADCPYAHEDAEKLQGRQILYEWLITKVDKTAVELEAKVDGLDLPVPLDVLATHADRRYGYCFLHRNIREWESRYALAGAIAEANRRGLHLHLVFSAQLLKPIENRPDLVRLSSAQRELAAKSEYDKPYRGMARHDRPHRGTGSLHFLDTESRVLTLLRGLAGFEGPQTFSVGKRWTSPISDVCIRPSSGEMVHPSEHDALTAWEQAAAERKRAAEQRRSAVPVPRPQITRRGYPASSGSPAAIVIQSAAPEPEETRPNRMAPCERCGHMTPEDDWIVYEGRTKTCKCRACMQASARPTSRGGGEGG